MRVRPTMTEVATILTDLGVRYTVDTDQDLCTRWEGCRIYLMLAGAERSALRAMVVLERTRGIEDKPRLVDLADDWNRSRLSAKAYTSVGDDGRVGLRAEYVFDFEVPVPRQMLVLTVRRWIVSLLRFATWAGERL